MPVLCFCLFFGCLSYLAIFRAHSWPYTQGFLLAGLKGPNRMLETEPRLTVQCKHPTISLTPKSEVFQNQGKYMPGFLEALSWMPITTGYLPKSTIGCSCGPLERWKASISPHPSTEPTGPALTIAGSDSYGGKIRQRTGLKVPEQWYKLSCMQLTRFNSQNPKWFPESITIISEIRTRSSELNSWSTHFAHTIPEFNLKLHGYPCSTQP